MPDQIGNISVPEIVASGTFPLVPDYPYGCVITPDVAIHQFGSGNVKNEQRFLLGNGAKRFMVRRAWLRDSERVALRDFWETKYGPYGAFTYNAPNDDGNGTTPYSCRFANEPLSWEMVANHACTLGVTLVEIPSVTPEHAVTATLQRFPSGSLATALLAQVQQLIPLIKIQPLQAGYPAIYLSDRRCIVGGQLYQARLLEFDGIQQGMGAEADDASFTFGNADRVMRDLANDVDLYRAAVSFSLFHVGEGIKLDLWKGDIINWSCDDGPDFKVSAADGLYELNLPYPCRKPSRTCSKPYRLDGRCPYASQGALDLVHFPSADASQCDKGYDTPNGCLAHGMKYWFGGVLAEPQGVRIKDNSTGTWGFGRSPLTSVSLVAESIYDQVLPEVYTDSPMPVNAKIAAGRDESDYYEALGVVCEGPVTFGSGHRLDGQYHHGHPGALGLREVVGNDPAGAVDYFSLDEAGNQTGGDWRKVYAGGSTYKDNFAAGTAFLVLRRSDPKGLQLSRPTEHQMEAVVAQGLEGWIWTDSGDHQTFTRSKAVLTNPLWIAVNLVLRARGVWLADAATQEQFFDVAALADATLVNGQPKGAALVCDTLVNKLVGTGQETQFKFRGVMQEEKPLRDWLQEVLMNCLGFFTFSFGKLKLGIRINSSAAEAFTEGNILFRSLALAPLKPSFNHLSANFADDEYGFVGNSITVYDIDHAGLVGGGTGPLFLKSNVNLAGTSSKSQAGRIISVRLREELGGITAEEWKRARQLSFRTTVLALNTEPGMVCSITHPAMPGGAGEFRVVSWRLNADYSIDIQGRTTTDSMYNLLTGPKPADVTAEPVPVEAVEPMPGDVRPFDNQPFAVEMVALPSGDVALDVVYDPPDPVGSFAGVYAIITTPDGKLHYPGDQAYNGDPAGDAVARRGSCRWILPSPGEQEEWRLAVGSLATTFRKDFVPHDAATGTPTPNRLITIDPVSAAPMEPAKRVTATTATARYGVFTELDGTQVLKVQASGTVTPDPTDSVFLCARITLNSAGGEVYEMGDSATDGTWCGFWREIPSGSYTVKAYSRNQANVELEEPFASPDPLVVASMPASPAITAPAFEIQEQLVEGVDGSLKHQWRVVGSWAQEASDYHWYTRAQLRVLSGADPRGLVRLGEAQGEEREILTDWFDAGATTTYQLEYVANNRMEMPNAPVVAGSFTVGPLGAVGDVMAFNAGTYDEDTEQWTAAMSWDPLKRFMLIDWGCLLPASRTNWSAVQVFIKAPNGLGGFYYVPATGRIGKDFFTPTTSGTMAYYDSIAIELKDVPQTPQAWTFIACSFDRGGNPKLDGGGNPDGPSIVLNTLTPEEKPDFTRPDDITGLDFTTEVVGPGEVDVVVTFNRAPEPASGAQVYLERPAGTEPREAGNFDYVGEGQQTVRFRETAPAANQSWKVRVVTYSLNNAGRLRDDSPSVTKTVSAYPLAPKVASGTAEVVTADSETAVKGRFGFAGTYPVPVSQYFASVEAVAVFDDDPTYEHILGRTWDGTFKTDLWPMPSAAVGVTIRLYSINHLDVRNPDYYAITGLTVSPDGALKPEKIPAGGIKDGHLDKANIPLAGFAGNLTVGRIDSLNTVNIGTFAGNLDVGRIDNLGSFNIGSFTGQLNVDRIANLGLFNINDFTGNLAVGRIANLGTFLVSDFAGSLTIDRISNLGSFNIANFAGNLPVGRIDNLGSFNIASFAGNLDVSRVANLNTVAVSSFTGSLNFDRVSNLGSFNIGSFAGVITTQQVQDGFLSDLAKFAADLRPITKVATLPALPSAAYPVDTVVLNLADSKLYKNVANVWTAVSAKDTITGKLAATDILSVDAGTIIGQINAGVITHVAISQFAGTLSAAQCGAISIHTFSGNLDVTRVNNLGTLTLASFSGNLDVSRVANLGTIAISSFSGQLNISRIDNLGTISINTFTGTLTADKITTINANNVTMVASWRDGQINDVNFSKLTVGQMNIGAGNVDINGTGSLRILGGGGITSGNIFCGGTLSVTTALNTTGAVQVIDMINRHATFVNLTVAGQFKTAYTADTGVGWSPVGKIACYNTVGSFIGWIPIVG